MTFRPSSDNHRGNPLPPLPRPPSLPLEAARNPSTCSISPLSKEAIPGRVVVVVVVERTFLRPRPRLPHRETSATWISSDTTPSSSSCARSYNSSPRCWSQSCSSSVLATPSWPSS